MYDKTKYLTAGDKGLIVEFGNAITPEINEKVRSLLVAIETDKKQGIISLNPTYRSLIIEYDPKFMLYDELIIYLKELEKNIGSMNIAKGSILVVPTFYGGEFGPDLPFVSENSGLSIEEVIAIHHSKDYLVYMLGFTPGFSYLGGMDTAIETPRLATPRAKISGGSVGIAGKQTGIYSMDSPGGWQLIGRTPINLYDPLRNPPILHKSGDYIRFVPITMEEYIDIQNQVKSGTYKYQLLKSEV